MSSMNKAGSGPRTPVGRPRKLAMALVAALASGSLFTSCDSRVKEAFVGGVKGYISILLDPTNFVDLLAAGSDDVTGDSADE